MDAAAVNATAVRVMRAADSQGLRPMTTPPRLGENAYIAASIHPQSTRMTNASRAKDHARTATEWSKRASTALQRGGQCGNEMVRAFNLPVHVRIGQAPRRNRLVMSGNGTARRHNDRVPHDNEEVRAYIGVVMSLRSKVHVCRVESGRGHTSCLFHNSQAHWRVWARQDDTA